MSEKKTNQTVSIEEYNTMRDFFLQQLSEKDKKIQDLEMKNKLLLKSALKESERSVELGQHSRALIEVNKELNEKLDKNKP
ncbi:TPA: hypothetical protein HA246_03345 [Candidatus Woesearchaeota archaeon]|nr:hypothetical protein [Candidatus Woesearchaeota archaeon]